MKKNFLMVASLLIAAMLMVVSCTQEVAPKNELVKASFSVGFGKDIQIKDFDGKNITYEYSVQPKWSKLESGVDPYGAVTNKKIEGEKSISQRVTNQTIGYLTPGLWEVTVKGYINYSSAESKGKLVLEGQKTTYITKDRSVVTVLVYPITEGTAKVSFDLEMQDLENNNEIRVEFYDIKGNQQGNTVILKKGVDGVSVTKIEGKAAYKYVKGASESDTNVFELPSVGYYTVKVYVPNYKGGYVRTFLATKDSTIAITGSVYPSEFIESSLNIVSVNVNNATVSVSGTPSDNKKNDLSNNVIKYYDHNSMMTFALDDTANTYLKDDEVTSLTTNSNVSNIERTPEYKWYINSTEVTNTSFPTASVSEDGKKLEYTFAPGSYSVSCVITYSVTFTYNDGTNSETKVFNGDAYSSEFIVE